MLPDLLDVNVWGSSQAFLHTNSMQTFELRMFVQVLEIEAMTNAVMNSIYSMHAKSDDQIGHAFMVPRIMQ